MSTVNELTTDMFKQVRIERNAFMLAAHFFDLHIGEDGIHAYFMWRRNNFRFPIIHHIADMMKRRSRGGKSRDEAIASDEHNIFIPYDQIQGVVTYEKHKEIQLLSTSEQVYLLFRPLDQYHRFVEVLKQKIPDKYFTRDNVEITDSVYISSSFVP